tara:strand:+ start:27513 stop:28406 length:894 start_codon:yes stop_codon:yes gene_type:complete
MNIYLFGSTNATGESFRHQATQSLSPWSVHTYSRYSSLPSFDFSNPFTFLPSGISGSPTLWICFGPIWLFASFIEQLNRVHPERLVGIRGVIACSSSSVITKRFSANRFDRELVHRLSSAEDSLLSLCRTLHVPCHILQPTLIYGKSGPYGDRNLSKILKLLRWLPFIPIPSDTGLRQPIHASQLAAVALHIAELIRESSCDQCLPERIPLGGDTSLTYTMMIRSLLQAQQSRDSAFRCRLLPIPNRLFFSLASPLLLFSPKAFEAVLRTGVNLSGFTPTHQLLSSEAQPFPVFPLA